MKIQSLELENWSSYKGSDNRIDFATTPGSEITVITAKNGAGKTSILKAFSFVLYGTVNSIISRSGDRSPLEDLPNRPAMDDGVEIVIAVTLRFEFEGAEWQLRREFTARQSAGLIILGQVSKSLIQVGKGAGISTEKIDDFVNDNLLNQQVSHFYFFDGVLLEEIQSQLTRKDEISRNLVMRSVENALGLRFLDHLNQNLRGCLTQADAVIAKQQKALNQNATLLSQIKLDEDKLEGLEQDVLAIRVLLDEQTLRKAEHDSRLLSIDPSTKEKALERSQLAETLKGLERDSDRAIANIRHCGESAWLSPLRNKLTDLFAEKEKSEKLNDETLGQVSALSAKVADLTFSFDAKSCALCGNDHDATKLQQIEDEITELKNNLQALPEHSISDRTTLIKLSKALRDSERVEVVEQAIRQHDEIIVKIGSTKRRIGRINDDLGNFQENIDVKMEESQRAEAEAKIKVYQERIDGQKNTMLQVETALTSNRAKLIEDGSISKKDQDTRILLSTLCTAIENSFDQFRNEMRLQVQEKATEYLKILTSEPDIYGSVEITPDYQIRIKTPEGITLQIANAGHKQILTTAFVSAMAAVSSEKTPFVMDTALSHLDIENSKQMLEWAKYVNQQVILLVTPKELPIEVAHRVLAGSIGREFEIKKLSAEVSEIKELH